MAASVNLATLEDVLNDPGMRAFSQKEQNRNARDLEFIELGIASFSERAENHCDRQFAYQLYTEVFSIKKNDQQELALRNTPIAPTPAVALKEDYLGNFSSVTGLDASLFYVSPSTGILTLRDYTFQRGVGCVQVTYQGGYPIIPDDLKFACVTQVVFEMKSHPDLGTQQASQESGSVTWVSQQMVPTVLDKLRPYRVITVR